MAESAEGVHEHVTAAQLVRYVPAHSGHALEPVHKDAMGERLENASETLKHIDARLAVMAGSVKSREDELVRRLITTWWTFLDRGRPKAQALAEAEPTAPAKR